MLLVSSFKIKWLMIHFWIAFHDLTLLVWRDEWRQVPEISVVFIRGLNLTLGYQLPWKMCRYRNDKSG